MIGAIDLLVASLLCIVVGKLCVHDWAEGLWYMAGTTGLILTWVNW